MKDHIKMKRRNGAILTWPCKLYIPVPLSTKNKFEYRSRLYRMSQAELGAVVVMHYLEEPVRIAQAVRRYKQVERELRQEYMARRVRGQE